jgi:hypothetical protein
MEAMTGVTEFSRIGDMRQAQDPGGQRSFAHRQRIGYNDVAPPSTDQSTQLHGAPAAVRQVLAACFDVRSAVC